MKVLLYSQNWGHSRGVSYLCRSYIKSLLKIGAEVTVLCFKGVDKNEPEFDLPIKKIYTDDFWQVKREFFEDVLESEKPDYCFFFEYDQWRENKDNLIDICLEKGVKPIGAWVAWERLFNRMIPNFKKFHKIFIFTKGQVKLFRKFGLTNTYYIPFGLDLDEFDNKHKEIDDKIVFLHTSGYGGIGKRRNTEAVIKAYEIIADENTSLIMTSQNVQTLPYDEIKKLYSNADCYLSPSKWEGLGIPNVESIISGTPVITTNFLPMNEIVLENKTGLLVDADDFKKTEEIGIEQQIINPNDLAEKMKIIKNRMIREILYKGCIKERKRFSLDNMSRELEKELR